MLGPEPVTYGLPNIKGAEGCWLCEGNGYYTTVEHLAQVDQYTSRVQFVQLVCPHPPDPRETHDAA